METKKQAVTGWNSVDLCLSTELEQNPHGYQFETAVNSNYYKDNNIKLTQLNQETGILFYFLHQQSLAETLPLISSTANWDYYGDNNKKLIQCNQETGILLISVYQQSQTQTQSVTTFKQL